VLAASNDAPDAAGSGIPLALRRLVGAGSSLLLPLGSRPFLAVGNPTNARPQRGCHVPHSRDAGGPGASSPPGQAWHSS